MHRVVTIDGPAGAGKSTVARRLASRLGWRFLDTGAMYRAVTLAAIQAGIDLSDDHALEKLCSGLTLRLPLGKVVLDGRDVSAEIRTAEVTAASRFTADNASVRARLVRWQREFAAEQNTVTEGRDQGTIVFPDAHRKFFLTATEEELARRRLLDYQAGGQAATLESVLADQRARDARDRARAIAPMEPAPDALIIDTTGKTLDDVIAELVERIAPER